MKAEIKYDGTLEIRSENELEAYALRKWLEHCSTAELIQRNILFVCNTYPTDQNNPK